MLVVEFLSYNVLKQGVIRTGSDGLMKAKIKRDA